MKFKTDEFGDRVLNFKDHDGDPLEVTLFPENEGGAIHLIAADRRVVGLTRKQLRKLAKEILKETDK